MSTAKLLQLVKSDIFLSRNGYIFKKSSLLVSHFDIEYKLQPPDGTESYFLSRRRRTSISWSLCGVFECNLLAETQATGGDETVAFHCRQFL